MSCRFQAACSCVSQRGMAQISSRAPPCGRVAHTPSSCVHVSLNDARFAYLGRKALQGSRFISFARKLVASWAWQWLVVCIAARVAILRVGFLLWGGSRLLAAFRGAVGCRSCEFGRDVSGGSGLQQDSCLENSSRSSGQP